MGITETKGFMLRTGCIERGWTKPEDVPAQLRMSTSPTRLGRWFERFYDVGDIKINLDTPRLVNHFTVGADPEFMFMTTDGRMAPAERFGLHTGSCVGADQNQRLVELRPAPSRRVLDIVASILAELRWLAFTRPTTARYNWISFPYEETDGIGGHVHFGRKNSTLIRDREVTNLDATFDLLLNAGVFSRLGQSRRVAATEYGRHGDVRPQRFGYEYRTFPTWLDTPWMAFLTLTISKLVVHHRHFALEGMANIPPAVWIMNLLAAYKGLDDDALLAYRVLLARGLPKQNLTDLRAAWAIDRHNYTPPTTYDPKILYPSKEEIAEVFKHFDTGEPLSMGIPSFFQTAKEIPYRYATAVKANWENRRFYALPELLSELIVYEDAPMWVKGLDEEDSDLFLIHGHPSVAWQTKVRETLKSFLPEAVTSFGPGVPQISVPKKYRKAGYVEKTRAFLTSGLFPIWHISQVQPDSYTKWEHQQAASKIKAQKSVEF